MGKAAFSILQLFTNVFIGIMQGMDSKSIQTVIFGALGILSMAFILGRMSVRNPIRRESKTLAFAGALVLLSIFGLSSTNSEFASGMSLLATVIAAVIATMSLKQTADLEKRRLVENKLDETITWLRGIDSRVVELLSKDLVERANSKQLMQLSIIILGESVNFGYFKKLNSNEQELLKQLDALETEYKSLRIKIDTWKTAVDEGIEKMVDETVSKGRNLSFIEAQQVFETSLRTKTIDPITDLINTANNTRLVVSKALSEVIIVKQSLLTKI